MSDPIRSISQNNYILATQQEVSHDNTLTGNGTPESPLGVANSSNETVLFSDTNGVDGSHLPSGMTDMTSFKYIRITIAGFYNKINGYVKRVVTFAADSTYFEVLLNIAGTDYVNMGFILLKNNGTSLSLTLSYVGKGGSSFGNDASRIRLYEVIGIN